MLRSVSSRLVLTFLLSAFALPLMTLAQPQDDQSVADAARRAREKKKSSAKPTRVVTEDDIPARIPAANEQPADAGAQPGNPAAPAANVATPAQPASSPGQQPGASASKDAAAKAADDAETAALKEVIAQAQKDADILKRDLALDQDTFFSNPDYVHDTAGKAKLDDLRQQIADKLDALEALKVKLAAHKPAAPAAPDATQPPPPAPQS